MPAAHEAHEAALAFDHVPPSHLVHVELAFAAHVPLAHVEHPDAPVAEATVPASHAMHDVWPVLA